MSRAPSSCELRHAAACLAASARSTLEYAERLTAIADQPRSGAPEGYTYTPHRRGFLNWDVVEQRGSDWIYLDLRLASEVEATRVAAALSGQGRLEV